MATQIDLAGAQIMGWSYGKHGNSLTALVKSIGLKKKEWLKIKKDFPSFLNESEKKEIDEYFKLI
jgi:hypothetical protein